MRTYAVAFLNSLLMTYLAVVVLTRVRCAKCSNTEVRPDVWQPRARINKQRAMHTHTHTHRWRCSHKIHRHARAQAFSLDIICKSPGEESYFPFACLLIFVLSALRSDCWLLRGLWALQTLGKIFNILTQRCFPLIQDEKKKKFAGLFAIISDKRRCIPSTTRLSWSCLHLSWWLYCNCSHVLHSSAVNT